MFIYTVLTLPAAVIAGLFIALRSKKAEDLSYGRLDKIGRISNIILILVYGCTLPFTMFLGMVSSPGRDGALGLLGWLVSVIIASAALPCGLGLGLSAALRKKGQSRASFIIQFAGIIGILLSFLLYGIFEGTLLSTLN